MTNQQLEHLIYCGIEKWVNTDPSKAKHNALGFRKDRDDLVDAIFAEIKEYKSDLTS